MAEEGKSASTILSWKRFWYYVPYINDLAVSVTCGLLYCCAWSSVFVRVHCIIRRIYSQTLIWNCRDYSFVSVLTLLVVLWYIY